MAEKYGVTAAGFVKMRLPEIRLAIIEDFKARLREHGLSDDIQTRPDSIIGILINTFADREASMWNIAEGVYNAMYPTTATGVSLDNAVSFSGVSRLQAANATATVIFYGDQGTYIPAGSEVRNADTQVVWATSESVSISSADAADVLIVPNVANNTAYTVTIDGVRYTYTSGNGATSISVLRGLAAALSSANYSVSTTGAAIRVSVKTSASMVVTLSSSLSFSEIGTPVSASPLDGVNDVASEGMINELVTLIAGVKRVSNMQSIAGRGVETDEELRRRYQTGVYTLGAATYDAIIANITDAIPTATDIKLFENDTDKVVNELKPHSIKLVIDGGNEDDIAKALHKYKAAGVDTNGDIVKQLQTDTGLKQIAFSRPKYRYIWIKAKLQLLDGTESQFPTDGFATIRQNLFDIGKALAVGDDVLLQKFFCGIFKVPGVSTVDLKFAVQTELGTQPSESEYSAQNIVINTYERAIFDLTRIEVS